MDKLREIQLAFQESLKTGNRSIIDYFSTPFSGKIADCLQVYCNDYYFRLRNALREDYTVLSKWIGIERFEMLLKKYLEENPSKTFTIREIGYQFPEFLEKNLEDASIIEMAKFECEIIKTLFSADADVLTMKTLSTIHLSDWANLKFQFHPSLRKLIFQYNTLDFWLAMDRGDPLSSLRLDVPSVNILWRFEHKVFFRSLLPEEIALLNAISCGETFSNLCQKMLDFFDEEHVVEWLTGILKTWVEEGIFTCYSVS